MRREFVYRLSAALLPLLIFWAVYEIVLSLLQLVMNGVLGTMTSGAGLDLMLLHSADLSAVLTAVAMAVALAVVGRTAGAEIRAFGERHKHTLFRLGLTDLVHTWTFTILMAVTALCLYLGLNVLVSLTGAGIYAGSSALGQTGVNFSMGIAVYGMVTPFAEEAAFRGMTFTRILRLFRPENLFDEDRTVPEEEGMDYRREEARRERHRTRRELEALEKRERDCDLFGMIVSSLLFGLWHGNLVQGLLGFAMGMVFSAAYYLTGNFILTVVLHAGCNIFTLLLVQTGVYNTLCTPVWCAGFLVVAAAGCCCLFFFIRHR